MASDKCKVCKNDIRVQCFKGTGICSTNCEKKRAETKEPQFAIAA